MLRSYLLSKLHFTVSSQLMSKVLLNEWTQLVFFIFVFVCCFFLFLLNFVWYALIGLWKSKSHTFTLPLLLLQLLSTVPQEQTLEQPVLHLTLAIYQEHLLLLLVKFGGIFKSNYLALGQTWVSGTNLGWIASCQYELTQLFNHSCHHIHFEPLKIEMQLLGEWIQSKRLLKDWDEIGGAR